MEISLANENVKHYIYMVKYMVKHYIVVKFCVYLFYIKGQVWYFTLKSLFQDRF